MKKLLAVLMVVVLCISLCACGGSDADDYARQAQLLEEKYNKAKSESDQFKNDVQEYYDAMDALENYY